MLLNYQDESSSLVRKTAYGSSRLLLKKVLLIRYYIGSYIIGFLGS
jgi:hypothetical protein